MKSIFILTISLLFACVAAGWSNPVALFGKNVIVRDYTTAMDEKGNTYIAYCTEMVDAKGNVSNSLIYTKMKPDNKLDNSKDFKLQTGCRKVKIQLGPEDKTIMIAYEGKRLTGLVLCTQANPYGCYDIYTTISTDLGETWSRVTPIRREALNDITDRLNPHFVVNKVLKRAFLFYTRRPISSEQPNLAYTTKGGADKEFGRESTFSNVVDGRLISVISTIEKYTTVIHAFYENEGRVKHLISTNVNTWEVDDLCNATKHYTQFVSGIGRETSVIAGIYTDGETTYFDYSSDHGKTWSKGYVLDNKYHKSAVATLTAKTDKEYELTILTSGFMSKNQTFISTTIPNVAVQVHPAPFADIKNFGVFMAQLNTYAESKEKRMRKAFGYIWINGTEPEVYVTNFSN